MNIKAIFFIFIVSLLYFSCSHRVIKSANQINPTIEIKDFDFDYFSGKARLVVKDEKSTREVKVNIRIRKDSVIWMSFNFIGLQGAKLLVNQDSITFVNNMEKSCYTYSFAKLSKLYKSEINYQTIQSLIMGNRIFKDKKIEIVSKDSSVGLISQNDSILDIKNYVNLKNNKIKRIEFKELKSNNYVDVSYSDFQLVGTQIFSFSNKAKILYKTPKGLFDVSIILDYNKADVSDKELKFPFNIPKRYELR